MSKLLSLSARGLMAGAFALILGVGLATSASADTVIYSTAYSGAPNVYDGITCRIDLLIAHNYNNSGHDYAAARIYGPSKPGAECGGILLQTTDGGNSWPSISGYHTVTYGAAYQTTYFYYDGPGHESMASGCLLSTSGECLTGNSTASY